MDACFCRSPVRVTHHVCLTGVSETRGRTGLWSGIANRSAGTQLPLICLFTLICPEMLSNFDSDRNKTNSAVQPGGRARVTDVDRIGVTRSNQPERQSRLRMLQRVSPDCACSSERRWTLNIFVQASTFPQKKISW